MSATFVHADDGGALSMVAKGDTILIGCNKGHAWIIRSTCITVAPVRTPPVLGIEPIAPGDGSGDQDGGAALLAPFGVDGQRALGLF